MSEIDWSAQAKVLEREDGGSDMYYEFKDHSSGTLAVMVAAVIAMPTKESARMVIDAGKQGTFNVGDIRKLAERNDYPG